MRRWLGLSNQRIEPLAGGQEAGDWELDSDSFAEAMGQPWATLGWLLGPAILLALLAMACSAGIAYLADDEIRGWRQVLGRITVNAGSWPLLTVLAAVAIACQVASRNALRAENVAEPVARGGMAERSLARIEYMSTISLIVGVLAAHTVLNAVATAALGTRPWPEVLAVAGGALVILLVLADAPVREQGLRVDAVMTRTRIDELTKATKFWPEIRIGWLPMARHEFTLVGSVVLATALLSLPLGLLDDSTVGVWLKFGLVLLIEVVSLHGMIALAARSLACSRPYLGVFTLVMQLPVIYSIGFAAVLTLPIRTPLQWALLFLPQLLFVLESLSQVFRPDKITKWQPVAVAGVRRAAESKRARLEAAEATVERVPKPGLKGWFRRATGRYPGPA